MLERSQPIVLSLYSPLAFGKSNIVHLVCFAKIRDIFEFELQRLGL